MTNSTRLSLYRKNRSKLSTTVIMDMLRYKSLLVDGYVKNQTTSPLPNRARHQIKGYQNVDAALEIEDFKIKSWIESLIRPTVKECRFLNMIVALMG